MSDIYLENIDTEPLIIATLLCDNRLLVSFVVVDIAGVTSDAAVAIVIGSFRL